jgi:putative glutamine amidotransferase
MQAPYTAQAMKPLIGIPLSLDDRGRWKSGRDYHYIDAAYTRAVEEAGGTAIYLPPQDDPSPATQKLDGLLMPGGDDLPPPTPYAEEVQFDLAPEAQRISDQRLLAYALERQLPVLAICYGMQLLTTALEGDLYYDLATDYPEAQPHRLPESEGRHGLRVEAGSRLFEALGAAPPPVNSLHHQGVRSTGPGVKVSARSDDGLIEAIERDGKSFCIGVQWHPEKLPGLHRQALFSAFIAACCS